MKKIIGLIILVLGFLVSGYGIFIFGGAIYYSIYSQSHPEQFGYGDAAGMGFFYGLIIIVVGIIPIVLGNLIMSGKQSIIYKIFSGKN
jgi:hypothetical protein